MRIFIVSFSSFSIHFHSLLLHLSTYNTNQCVHLFLIFLHSTMHTTDSPLSSFILWSKKCEKSVCSVQQEKTRQWQPGGANTRNLFWCHHLFYNCKRCILFIQSIMIECMTATCQPICMLHSSTQTHVNFNNSEINLSLQ